MDHKWYDVPCEMCVGTGKRRVFIYKNQPCLPIGILLKAEEIFSQCSVESSDSAQFVLRFTTKGTFEEIRDKEVSFRKWIDENYPDEVGSRLVLSIGRIKSTLERV